MWVGPLAWLLKVGAIAGLIGGGYLWFANHHYDRGWAAREAQLATEVADVNGRRAALNAAIEAERSRAERERDLAVLAAVKDTQAHCSANPAACGVAAGGCAQTCTMPESVRASLNRIR